MSGTDYRTIAADPPWQPELGGNWGARVDKGRSQRFYGTMPLEDIKALEVPSAPQAHLYLWCLSQTAGLGQQAGLTYTLAWELAYRNDETYERMTPEERYTAFLAWIDRELAGPAVVTS
jgi:hypothetical protein